VILSFFKRFKMADEDVPDAGDVENKEVSKEAALPEIEEPQAPQPEEIVLLNQKQSMYAMSLKSASKDPEGNVDLDFIAVAFDDNGICMFV
jgi:hypothetical protein